MAGLKSKSRLCVRYVMFEVRSKLWCLSMPVGSGVGLFLAADSSSSSPKVVVCCLLLSVVYQVENCLINAC